MAIFLPEHFEDCNQIKNGRKRKGCEGEKFVFNSLQKALKGDSEFIVFYSAKMDYSHRESDFLIFYQKYGLLFLEVKNWNNVQYNSKIKKWEILSRKGEIKFSTNPLTQAQIFSGGFKKLWEKVIDKNKIFPGVSSELVALVQQNDIDKEYAPEQARHYAGRSILEDAQKMKSFIKDAFENYAEIYNIEPLRLDTIDKIREQFHLPAFPHLINYYTDIQLYEKYIKEETVNFQNQFLEKHIQYKNWIIEGEAGTGKSYLAMKLANKLIWKNKKGIYLVQREEVASQLKQRLKNNFNISEKSLTIMTLSEMNKNQKHKIHETSGTSALASSEFIDFIIVDEAQDLTIKFLKSLKTKLTDEDTGLYIFLDPRQRLSKEVIVIKKDNVVRKEENINYYEGYNYFISELCKICRINKPFLLTKVVRSSQNIVNFIHEYAPLMKLQADKEIKGLVKPGYKTISKEDLLRFTLEKISEWKKNFHIDEKNIVLLAEDELEENQKPESIESKTIISYRGCESQAVILWLKDWPNESSQTQEKQELFYIGASRAKHLLWIFSY